MLKTFSWKMVQCAEGTVALSYLVFGVELAEDG